MSKISPRLMMLVLVFSLLGAGCRQGGPSIRPSLQKEQASSVGMTTTQSHGATYSSEEAGIPENYEDQWSSLVYLRELTVTNGKIFAKVDPVRFIDCRKRESLHRPIPKSCATHPEVGFAIENDDTMTHVYEMATSSGPFFLNRIGDGEEKKRFRTMDLPTIQGLLNGTIDPMNIGDGYYDPILHEDPMKKISPNLFYILKKNDVIEKMVEKYRA